MDFSKKESNNNIVFIVWFLFGGLLSLLSYYDLNYYFSNSLPYFLTKTISYYYDYSDDNKAIVFLFWFYLVSSPLALFFHCKLATESKKVELPTLYISLFGAVFMVIFMVSIFLFRNSPVDFYESGKMMRLLYWMITMSWWSTFVVYSLMYFVLFNSISSSINHYLNRKGI